MTTYKSTYNTNDVIEIAAEEFAMTLTKEQASEVLDSFVENHNEKLACIRYTNNDYTEIECVTDDKDELVDGLMIADIVRYIFIDSLHE